MTDGTRTTAPTTRRQRLTVLAICSMSLLIVGLDITIVNVALPAIRRSLSASIPGLQWVIDAYTLAIASLLLLAGSTADRIGRRRLFSLGLLLFTLASAACAAAPSLGLLIAARTLQGIAGSMLNPVALSIIRNTFLNPRERAGAIGVWGAMQGISGTLGPVIGGALVDTVGWRSVFLVNLPIGLTCLVLTRRFVPESRAPHPRPIDPVGQILTIVGLGAVVYAIIEGQADGWTSTGILALFATSAVALAVLVAYELRYPAPMLEFRFFSSAPFAGASAIGVLAFVALGGYLFVNTLYLQDVRHLSAFHAGLYVLPLGLVNVITAPIAGRIVASRGTRLPLLIAGVALALSPLPLLGLTPTTSPGALILSYVLFGLGSGFVNPPVTHTAISGMPPAQAGVAAAITSTSRSVGQVLGIAAIGAIVGAGATRTIGPAFAQASHTAWWIVLVLGVAVIGLAAVTTSAWAEATAVSTAARLAPGGAAAS